MACFRLELTNYNMQVLARFRGLGLVVELVIKINIIVGTTCDRRVDWKWWELALSVSRPLTHQAHLGWVLQFKKKDKISRSSFI